MRSGDGVDSHVAEWLIIGGGPCGVQACGVILDSLPSLQPYDPTINHQDQRTPVIWLDERGFQTLGRFGQYRSVPGNTLVSIIVNAMSMIKSLCFEEDQYARLLQLKQNPSEHSSRSDSVLQPGARTLLECDPTQTCDLSLAIDALEDASARLRAHACVTPLHARACSLTWVPARAEDGTSRGSGGDANGARSEAAKEEEEENEGQGYWRVELSAPPTASASSSAASASSSSSSSFPPLTHVRARRVLLVPGRVPKEPSSDLIPAGVKVVPVDHAVTPNKLRSLLEEDEEEEASVRGPSAPGCSTGVADGDPTDREHRSGRAAQSSALKRGAKWCIVGGSHSGMLAAMNLVGPHGLDPSAKVTVLYRSPLLHAEVKTFPGSKATWIKYDGTGLKGTVSEWVKQVASEASSAPPGDAAVRFVLDPTAKVPDDEHSRQPKEGGNPGSCRGDIDHGAVDAAADAAAAAAAVAEWHERLRGFDYVVFTHGFNNARDVLALNHSLVDHERPSSNDTGNSHSNGTGSSHSSSSSSSRHQEVGRGELSPPPSGGVAFGGLPDVLLPRISANPLGSAAAPAGADGVTAGADGGGGPGGGADGVGASGQLRRHLLSSSCSPPRDYNGRTGVIALLAPDSTPTTSSTSSSSSSASSSSSPPPPPSVLPLFGAGFGFPEQWTDPEGRTEVRVGFSKVYVEHIQRMVREANKLNSSIIR